MNGSAVQLAFSATQTHFIHTDSRTAVLELSPALLAQACFRHVPPQAGEIEHAIDLTEEALMAARLGSLGGGDLISHDALLHRLPGLQAAGSGLSRDAVEALFDQLARAARGLGLGLLPADAETAAALLMLRECLHHGGFSAVQMDA